MTATPLRDADEILVGFTLALRSAGVAVTQDRSQSYLDAVAVVGLGDARATRAAGRATLCASPEDLERHDRVFEEWFGAGPARLADVPPDVRRPPPTTLLTDVADEAGGPSEGNPARATVSATEVLRHRDFATLDAAERARLAALFAGIPVALPTRRAARRTAWRRGEVDASRTLRASLRRMGEPTPIHRRHRRERARRVVFLVDVSGSMSGYADAHLRLAHRFVSASRHGRCAPAATGGAVEVFSIGTRLTRLTRALQLRDPDRAIAAAGAVVPDWSGGTRLGETVKAFLDRWGRRGLARGAVVVVLSDGWERGDARLLGEQLAHLQRLAHRVIWVNPHRGKPGYEPVQQGIVAVLPHVDALLAGHSLATFAELSEEIGRA